MKGWLHGRLANDLADVGLTLEVRLALGGGRWLQSGKNAPGGVKPERAHKTRFQFRSRVFVNGFSRICFSIRLCGYSICQPGKGGCMGG